MSIELKKYSMTMFMGTPSLVLDPVNGNWVNLVDHEEAVRQFKSTINHLEWEVKELTKEVNGW